MPVLLDRMPFFEEQGEVIVHGEPVKLRANQIILWMTLGSQKMVASNPAHQPFPVILDTGHTHNFSIQERHVIEWAGMQPSNLAVIGSARDRGLRVMLYAAKLWVHPNLRGERDRIADRAPYLLEARGGIAIYTSGDFPRISILGLRAIADNELTLKICGKQRQVTLRTATKWWWPFG